MRDQRPLTVPPPERVRQNLAAYQSAESFSEINQIAHLIVADVPWLLEHIEELEQRRPGELSEAERANMLDRLDEIANGQERPQLARPYEVGPLVLKRKLVERAGYAVAPARYETLSVKRVSDAPLLTADDFGDVPWTDEDLGG